MIEQKRGKRYYCNNFQTCQAISNVDNKSGTTPTIMSSVKIVHQHAFVNNGIEMNAECLSFFPNENDQILTRQKMSYLTNKVVE